MDINDIFTVNIEKMTNQGAGIAHVDGFVIFVSGACPGDKAEIEITKINKSYAYAKIINILEPSIHRVKPFCPIQNACGACQLQHIDYNYQLEIKSQFVKDALHAIGNIDIEVPTTLPSPNSTEYRHKVQYPVAQTKVSKRLLAGYYKPNSHEIVNIKHCPIQPPICDEIIDFIRNNIQQFNITGYNESKHAGDLRHIVLRISANSGKVLVTLVFNAKKISKKFSDFAQQIFEEFSSVVGVCANLNPKNTNVILSDNTVCLAGENFVEEKVLEKTFKIGATTFFQVNPKSAENIFNYVKQEIQKLDNPDVLDAYAGIATFGILVSDISKTVVSVESNKESIEKAKEVLELNNINNVELFAEDTTKYLKRIKRKFDLTIIDPPRKGCSVESLVEVLKHTKQKIIYVSCNPSTLARDLKYLTENGCKIESVQPFDMFCHSYHVETVVVLNI